MAQQQRKEKNPLQIIRFDGNNVFVEVMNAFEIGKVMISFIEYDLSKEKNNRITGEIHTYMDMEQFLVLAHDIKTGRLSALGKQAKKAQEEGGYKYCKEIFVDHGGISASKLEERGQARPDGKALSRQFKITPGDRKPWILSGEIGAGEENDTGFIKLVGRPEKVIRVPLTDEDLKKFALVVEKHIQGYLTAFYMQLAEEKKK